MSMRLMLKELKEYTWKGIYNDCYTFCKVCPDCDFCKQPTDEPGAQEEVNITDSYPPPPQGTATPVRRVLIVTYINRSQLSQARKRR